MAKRRANSEGSIRKRKDGRWEGRYTAGYDPETGKRIIKNVLGRTQAEVKEKLKTAIGESQRLDISKAGNYTVAEWVRTWYAVYAAPRIRPNTNSVRTLAIPQQAVDLLIEEHKKHPGNRYMFPSPKTGTMYDPDAFRRTHDKILKAIGAEHVRFHDMRHLFATLSLKNGVDVKTLSGALGHYSAGFTLNTYTHATAQMKQDAADTIGAVISGEM